HSNLGAFRALRDGIHLVGLAAASCCPQAPSDNVSFRRMSTEGNNATKLPHRRQFLYLAAGLGGAALGGAAIWPAVRALQLQVLRLQAEVVAAKIDQFIGEIESQIHWTTLLPWSAETIDQWRFVGSRLLRQVPAITKLSWLDAAGKEQASVS